MYLHFAEKSLKLLMKRKLGFQTMAHLLEAKGAAPTLKKSILLDKLFGCLYISHAIMDKFI